MRTTVDVINLSPCTALDDDVVEHVWSEKDVFYRRLRVFSYRTFAHIPDNERSKLDGKTKEYIFLATHMINLVTSFGIQKSRKCLEADMWSSLRIKHLRI